MNSSLRKAVEAARPHLGDYTSLAKVEAAVRAVLEAIRELSDEQYDALSNTGLMWREQTSRSVYRTCIDAILAPGED